MAQLIADCPRCNVKKIAFRAYPPLNAIRESGAASRAEVFCICPSCYKATIFTVRVNSSTSKNHLDRDRKFEATPLLSHYVDVAGYVSIADLAAVEPPQHLPANLHAMFVEGAKCVAVQCYNAAGAMFRLCLDTITKEKLAQYVEAHPGAGDIPKAVNKYLYDRLEFLFSVRAIDPDLQELSHCVRQDGNDGAHDGTLGREDAEDLQDFTKLLLERLYTGPARVRLAASRRNDRRGIGEDSTPPDE